MTTVLVAYGVSLPVMAVIVGHYLAGRSVVTTVREFAASPRARAFGFWAAVTVGCFALALATRGQVVTWDGVVAVQP